MNINKSCSSYSGFTLIEVMIGLIMLSIVWASFSCLMHHHLSSTQRLTKQEQGLIVLRNYIEYLKIYPSKIKAKDTIHYLSDTWYVSLNCDDKHATYLMIDLSLSSDDQLTNFNAIFPVWRRR